MCIRDSYGAACKASRVANTTSTTLISFDPRTVTVAGLVSDQHIGGMVSWQPLGKPTERRTILSIQRVTSGTTYSVLTLAGAPREVENGIAVEVSLGCKHTIGDCRDVFGNAPNFGGMPYIPVQNPHGSTRIYN